MVNAFAGKALTSQAGPFSVKQTHLSRKRLTILNLLANISHRSYIFLADILRNILCPPSENPGRDKCHPTTEPSWLDTVIINLLLLN